MALQLDRTYGAKRHSAQGLASSIPGTGMHGSAQQKSLVELAALHHQALEKLMKELSDHSRREKLLRASVGFLAECLSPYEMAHLGFQDGVKALRQLNQTLEEEIKRIAYSVHDESGQLLVAVHLALADLGQELPERQKEKITKIEDMLSHVEKQLRRYSHELRPTVLDDLGWIPAVRFLADAVSKRVGLSIDVHTEVTGRPRSLSRRRSTASCRRLSITR